MVIWCCLDQLTSSPCSGSWWVRDLDEDECPPVAGDDVDLPERAAEVTDEDLVTLLAQVAGGEVLAAVAERVLLSRALARALRRRGKPSLEEAQHVDRRITRSRRG